MRLFTDEEKDQIWDWHQAGVPVKRIARGWVAITPHCASWLARPVGSALELGWSTSDI